MMEVHREAVFAKAAGYYPRAVLEAWAPGAIPDRVARVEEEIADPDFTVLVAEAAGEVIGFAMAVPSTNELRAVYVRPNRVGRVGRALLAEVERSAFAQTDRLACDASLSAERFYRANGSNPEARMQHAFARGGTIDCLRMTKLRPADQPHSV
jgi:Acetyltransferase (GNAT) domain